jgi:ABC-2 type transport system permease protein
MPESRPDWLPVARWEFVRIVRRADFILSVLLTPAFLFVVSLVMGRVNRADPVPVAVVRLDRAGTELARGPAALPPRRGVRWVDPGPAGADTTALIRAVRERRYEAALVVRGDSSLGAPLVDLVTRRERPRWAADLAPFLARQARGAWAARAGLGPAEVAALGDSITLRAHVALAQRSGSRRGDFLLTFAVLLLMTTVIMVSISYLMVGISGEKSARVTEVVISAVPAQAWMDGKLIAFTGVGLVVGVAWAAALLLMAGSFAFVLPATVNVPGLLLTALFALLGLYLYNALIAGLMASAQSLQSASKWQSNFVALPFIPVMFLGALIEHPDSPAMAILSQLPVFSPVMVPARFVLGGIRPWEVALALALLALACWFTRLAAGRVFRLGMLMYGKDMTLPELLRWARVK